MKIKKIYSLFFLAMFLSFLFTIHGAESVKAQESIHDSDAFLEWYSTNKDNNYETYELEGNLYLDQGTMDSPILLNGTGKGMTIDCNGYSVFIQSNVVIDHKDLYFLTDWKDAQPILVVMNKDQRSPASLTLKNGGASGNQIALQVVSGELHCPEGENMFYLNGAQTALDIQTSNVTLRNLNIYAEAEQNITAVKAKSDVTVIDTSIFAQKINDFENCNDVVALEAGNQIVIQNSDITAQGQGAKSVVSKRGLSQIKVDTPSILTPALDLGMSNQDKYKLIQIKNPIMINVSRNTLPSQIDLPTSIPCTISSLSAEDGSKEVIELSVNWDVKDFSSLLQTYGEHQIYGTFSQDELDQYHIYMESSFQPLFQFKVVPSSLMNTLNFTDMMNNGNISSALLQLYRPYQATSLFIQYSSDGINWTNGYCIRERDQQQDENILNCETNPSDKILSTIYFPNMTSNGYLRSKVIGGLFQGTWQPLQLIEDNAFTPPGLDGGGGNRGGGGQQETKRDVGEEDDSTTSQQSDVQSSYYPQSQAFNDAKDVVATPTNNMPNQAMDLNSNEFSNFTTKQTYSFTPYLLVVAFLFLIYHFRGHRWNRNKMK